MSLENTIDVIAIQLAKQRQRSVMLFTDAAGRTSPKCGYRGDNGTMCAVGCIIPDELYTPQLESRGTVYNVLNQGPLQPEWTPDVRDYIYGLVPELNEDTLYRVLDAFQHWHDRETFSGRSISGVSACYQDVLNANPDATDEELKAIIVDHLTTTARRWIKAEEPQFVIGS